MALTAVLERFQTNLLAHQFQTLGAHGFHYAMRTPHAQPQRVRLLLG
jgi:hypothetical protein